MMKKPLDKGFKKHLGWVEKALVRRYNANLDQPLSKRIKYPRGKRIQEIKEVYFPEEKGKTAKKKSKKKSTKATLGRIQLDKPSDQIRRARHDRPPRELKVRDLLNHQFKTFQLSGELGRFLGDLERNQTAILLEGNPGSGKSTLALMIANLLLKQGMKGKFFSLEMGLTDGLKKTAKRIKLHPDFTITADGSLEEVRTEAARSDFVVIDSWQKLREKSAEFERLRKDFPYTIFIIVFQLRGDGKV